MTHILPEIPTRLGRYQRGALLGRGGMGAVFRARDPQLGRDVALKVLLIGPEEDVDGLRRFLREIRALAAIQDPGIVRIFDCGFDAPWYFFTMELLEGHTLSQLVAAQGRLAPSQVVSMGRTLAGTLATLHGAGMVHRDVKPQNVFVGPDGRITLMDLGLVKLNDATLVTAEGQTVGTPHYLAPEVIVGKAADARTDIYQLGLVLYEAATGRCAFDAPTLSELLRRMRLGIFSSPTSLVPAFPGPLESVICEAMAIDPAKRPATAQVLGQRLRGVERHLSGKVPPTPALDRLSAPSGDLEITIARGGSPPLERGTSSSAAGRRRRLVGPSVVGLLGITVATYLSVRAGTMPGIGALMERSNPSPVASAVVAPPSSRLSGGMTLSARAALQARLAVIEDLVLGGSSRVFDASLEMVSPDPDGIIQKNATYVDEDQKVLAEVNAIDRDAQRRMGDADTATNEDLSLRIRILAWRFVASCRRERALIALRAARRAKATGGDAAGAFLLLAKEAHYSPDAARALSEYVHWALSLFQRAAMVPSDAGPEVASVLSEVASVAAPLAWEREHPGSCRGVTRALKASLDRLPGPAGSVLGRVVSGLWDVGESGYRLDQLSTLAPVLRADLDDLKRRMPRAATAIEALKDLTRSRAASPAAGKPR